MLEYFKTEIFAAYGEKFTDEVFDVNRYWTDEDYPCILGDEDLKQSNLFDPLNYTLLESEEYKIL